MDYREYAIRQLRSSIDKTDDAPASSQMHEMTAIRALRMQRIPELSELLETDLDDVIRTLVRKTQLLTKLLEMEMDANRSLREINQLARLEIERMLPRFDDPDTH